MRTLINKENIQAMMSMSSQSVDACVSALRVPSTSSNYQSEDDERKEKGRKSSEFLRAFFSSSRYLPPPSLLLLRRSLFAPSPLSSKARTALFVSLIDQLIYPRKKEQCLVVSNLDNFSFSFVSLPIIKIVSRDDL
jgi:hypothetical protein